MPIFGKGHRKRAVTGTGNHSGLKSCKNLMKSPHSALEAGGVDELRNSAVRVRSAERRSIPHSFEKRQTAGQGS